MQTTMFQPKGGMDMIGKGFYRQMSQDGAAEHARDGDFAGRHGRDRNWQDAKTGQTGSKRGLLRVHFPRRSEPIDCKWARSMKADLKAGCAYSNSVKIGSR